MGGETGKNGSGSHRALGPEIVEQGLHGPEPRRPRHDLPRNEAKPGGRTQETGGLGQRTPELGTPERRAAEDFVEGDVNGEGSWLRLDRVRARLRPRGKGDENSNSSAYGAHPVRPGREAPRARSSVSGARGRPF